MRDIIKRIASYIIIKFIYRNKIKLSITVRVGVKSHFEGANRIYANSFFSGCMGYGSYLGQKSFIKGKIGRFTSIAPDVKCNCGCHPYTYPFVTTCPMFYSTLKQNGYSFSNKQLYHELRYVEGTDDAVHIGSDCWIGERTFIIGGVTINDGAIVLAGAVVTKDVPPYAIVGGIPAKILKYRYSKEDIQFLLNFRWWEKEISWLKENYVLLTDIALLKKTIAEIKQ